jgi:hypothetical protein
MVFKIMILKFSNLLKYLQITSRIILIIPLILIFTSCSYLKKDKDELSMAGLTAEEKRRKNIDEGRGAGLAGLMGGGRTTYEFSSSNPLWRASLETLDFIPLNTVDYSGGMIITDWYSESSDAESLKITVRFLSNEIRSDSLKIIVHSKNCNPTNNCKISLHDGSKIQQELNSVILTRAASLEKEDKKPKKKKN